MKKKVKIAKELLPSLFELYKELSNKKIKSYLKSGSILVNGKVITQYNYLLKVGDIIEIVKDNKTHKFSPLPIVYEDDNFLVIDKPNGLLSIATEKEKEKTAYHMMREFVRKRGRGEKIFILHRLDKDTSGILVFVKNERLKLALQKDWEHLAKCRQYLAIIEGKIKDMTNYTCYLEEDKNYQVHVVSTGGKKAVTSIKTVKTNKKYSLVQVEISTGRKNQIRVVLSHLGYPVVGDKKYAKEIKKEARLYLHASKLEIKNPLNQQIYTFTSKSPKSFDFKMK